jgi:flagellar motor switch protein FliM
MAMGVILNQRDVDFLLLGAKQPDAQAAEGPAAAPPDVRPYSFLHPERWSGERRAALDSVHESFAAGIADELAVQLNLKPEVRLAAFEVVPAPEVLLSLGSPCAASLFHVGDSGGPLGLLDLNRPLAFGLLDRVLGGEGEPTGPDRPLSPLEQGLLRGVIDRILPRLREAWKEQVAVSAEVAGFETNPAQCDLGGPESRLLVSVFEIDAAPLLGRMTVALPVERLGLLVSTTQAAGRESAR